MTYEYKTYQVNIDDMTELDELLAVYIQAMGYRMIRAQSPAPDGNRFKYQNSSREYSATRGEFVEMAGYLNKTKALGWIMEERMDLNHDGGTPRIWTASMINSNNAVVPGIFTQSSDEDPDKAVFKLYLKSRSKGGLGIVEMPV